MSTKRLAKERAAAARPKPDVAAETWQELQAILDQELKVLPDIYRAAIVLCDLEGKSIKEAARQLGCPQGTVGTRLARGRILLSRRLARHGLTLPAGLLATALAHNAAAAGLPPLLAAGEATAPGTISAKVAALTEGMLKAMLMTKLKIATAILFVVSTVALTCGVLAGQQQPAPPGEVKAKPQIKPGQPPKEDKDSLQGTWRLVGAEVDGVTFGEGRPEIKDTRMVFDKSSVTLFGKIFHSPRLQKEPEDTKAVGSFTLDARKSPKVILFTWETNPWNDKKDFVQRSIYTLDGDCLKLCTSLPSEDKQLLPTEFSAKFGSKQSLNTFKREPASKKGEEKQP
jgi:uncharacterized protein (TIGR03067 family)